MKLNEVIKSMPTSNAAIKNTASVEPVDGWYPAYSASGQDVWLPDYRFDHNGLVVSAVGARCGKVFKADGKWNVCANTHSLFVDETKASRDYCWYMINNESWWIKGGTAQPFVKVKDSLNRDHDFPTLAKQKFIVNLLDQTQNLIQQKTLQIQRLDTLIKARFVEMFGDPETNPKNWERVTVDDVCLSIVRGPFGSALKKEFFVDPDETTYKVYEQKHAIQKRPDIGAYYITSEKFSELRRFECVPGDILMSCSGTMGELYQLPDGCEHGIINQALCKFTLNKRILPIYFLTYMQRTVGNLETKGSGIKNIAAVSYVKTMPINLPPLDLQNQFATFIRQVDKSKFAVQKSLEKTQQLFDSLMQEYFG